MLSILDPNRAVDSNYFSYSLVTSSGKVHTGLVASETPTAVSLRQPEGKSVRVLRGDIEVLKSNGVSLMPEGLEKNVTLAQMSDLLSFLKNWRYLDGRVPVKLPGTTGK
jgi:putative heme-binding domain-containing protein